MKNKATVGSPKKAPDQEKVKIETQKEAADDDPLAGIMEVVEEHPAPT